MIDRLRLAIELTAHIIEPFAILAACGFAAVAFKTFQGVVADLRKDSRSEQSGCKPRQQHGRPGGLQRKVVGALTSQRGSIGIELLFVAWVLLFVGAFYLALGPVAALVTAVAALLLAGAYAVGDKANRGGN